MALSLTAAERRTLKQRAHHLKPIVQTGAAGLTDPVLAEIDRALTDHELVKIKLAVDDKQALAAEVEQICTRLNATSVQKIGRTATLFRPRPEDDA